jgi:type II secretory pathway pseudopilin PulG
MRVLRRRRRGFTILSVLMALAIIGVLTQNYMGTDTPTGVPYAVYTTNRARAVVMASNLRTAQTQLFMATEGRMPPPDRLRVLLDDLSNRMGGGGRFFVDKDMNLFLTTTDTTVRFAEQYTALPRQR